MTQIIDGRGKGFTARVNSDNRLFTFADSVPAGTIAAADKLMWSIATEDVTLTSDSASAVLYVQYTGDSKLVIPRLTFTVGASTGGSGNTTIEVLTNPTTGTIVSGASQATVTNRNFAGTSGSLSGSQFKGAEGNTLTDGSVLGALVTSSVGPTFQDQNEFPYILEKGNSIGFKITPPTGNTSQTNRIFLVAYELVVD